LEFHRQITTIVGDSTKNRVPGEMRPSGSSLLSLKARLKARSDKIWFGGTADGSTPGNWVENQGKDRFELVKEKGFEGIITSAE
jgi:hypothetical protein